MYDAGCFWLARKSFAAERKTTQKKLLLSFKLRGTFSLPTLLGSDIQEGGIQHLGYASPGQRPIFAASPAQNHQGSAVQNQTKRRLLHIDTIVYSSTPQYFARGNLVFL